jgi:hypothetical protein
LGSAISNHNTTGGGIALGGSTRIQVDQTGNIGIGNTAPTAKLDVTGGIAVSSGLTVSNGINSFTSSTTTGNINTFSNSLLSPALSETANLLNLALTNGSTNTSGTSTTTGLNIATTNNAIGSGGTQETYGIRIQDIAGTSGAGTQNNYGIRIGNQGLTSTEKSYGLYVDTQSGSTANYAAVFAGGSVGIGNIAPGTTLDVTGTGRFSSTLTASNAFTLSTGALSLTATSGSENITGYGTSSKTSTTTTGNINTFADSSLVIASGATGNLMNLTFTNASTNTTGTSTATGLNIAGTLTANGTSGTHETYGIRIQDLAGSPTGNGTQNNYGLRIGNQGKANTESAYGLYVNSQTGSTANYAAVFAGGSVGIGTTVPNYILDVQPLDSSKVNSKNGYLTNGADYAEYMPNDTSTSSGQVKMRVGDIVGLNVSTGNVRKYQQGDTIVGIVSDGIGFVGNGNKTMENDPNYTLVGMVGQLVFDSSQVVVKNNKVYTKDNKLVGNLLSNGKVLVNGFTDLVLNLDGSGNVVSPVIPANPHLIGANAGIQSTNIDSGMTDDMLNTQYSILDTKYASMSAQLADIQKQLDVLKNASTSAQVLGAQTVASNSATLALVNAITDDHQATFSSILVSDKANINDLAVTGTIQNGLFTLDGLNGTLNTLATPLKLQSLATAPIEFEGGLASIDTKGNFTLDEGDLTIKKGVIRGNDDIRGRVILKSGKTFVHITKSWAQEPVTLTLTPFAHVDYWIENLTSNGFDIRINESQTNDITFSWVALW